MSERLGRFLNLIMYIQNRPGISAKELADRLEVNIRTIYRDIQWLRDQGFPIENYGKNTGYRFSTQFAMYPLEWTAEERRAISFLPTVLEQLKGLVSPETLSALEKIVAVIRKKRLEEETWFEHLAQSIQVGTPAYMPETKNFLSVILEAIHSRRTIQATYFTQSRLARTERKIDPYFLVPRELRFYVVGYCHLKKDIRIFRLSRFENVVLLPRRFTMKDFDLAQYLKNTWSIIRGDDHIQFKIKFSPSIAGYIKEEEMFLRPILRDMDDGSLLMEVTVNHEQEFLKWLMQYGPEAEILQPRKYREKMKEILNQWKKTYVR